MKKLALILLAGALITGCGAKENEKAVKEINVYTALENEQIPVFLENFKKHYPDIKVNITRDSTGVVITKVLALKVLKLLFPTQRLPEDCLFLLKLLLLQLLLNLLLY